MSYDWSFYIDIGIISVALLLATVIRSKVRFFQKFLIPNALTAGFILLPFYNFLAPALGISSQGLGQIVFHLLSISFVAMTLRRPAQKRGKSERGVLATSAVVIFQFGMQGFIGLILTYVLMTTVVPDLFPAFGLFVPLGFALGPGQAFTIGTGWQELGFEGAGSVGLTFAALGYLLACFAGVFLINHGLRKGWASSTLQAAQEDEPELKDAQSTGIVPRDEEGEVGSRLTTYSDAIDTMSVNTGIVLGTYFASYLLLQLLSWLLAFVGDLGTELANNLWGISFVFAMLTALLVKKLLYVFKWDHVLDQGSLTRLSGASVDLMVAASVGAISLVVVAAYWLPIIVIGVVASIAVFLTVPWLASRIFQSYRLQRTVIIFGAMTGTLPTGLALLRVLDPGFKTPVAGDYVYSSAIVFAALIPAIVTMNLPAYSVTRNDPKLFWFMVLIIGAYIIIGLVLYAIFARKRAFRSPGKWWFSSKEK